MTVSLRARFEGGVRCAARPIRRVAVPLALWSVLLLGAAAADGPRPHSATELAIVRDARDLLESGEPEAALARLDAWEGEPSSLRLFLLARAREELGREVDAASAYRRCLALRPGFATARQALLANLHRRERYAELLRVLPPGFPEGAPVVILSLAADAAYRAGDRALCDELAGTALLRHPDAPSFRRLLLLRAIDDGDDHRAAAYLADALAAEPTDAALWQHAAAVRGRLDDPAGERAALRAAVLLAPEDRTARLCLARALSAGGQHRAALRHARHLASAGAADAELRGFCADLARLAGEHRTALAWLEAIPEGERSPELRVRRALVLIRLGERAAAHAALAELIAAGGFDADVLLMAADNALVMERDGEAGAWYAQARSVLPPDDRRRVRAALGLARVALRSGDRTEARRVLRACARRHPGDPTPGLMLRFVEGPP